MGRENVPHNQKMHNQPLNSPSLLFLKALFPFSCQQDIIMSTVRKLLLALRVSPGAIDTELEISV